MEHQSNLWSEMNGEILELVFSKLSERFVLRAASVCKRWNSLVRDPSFVEFYRKQVDTASSFCFPFKGANYLLTMSDKDVNILKLANDCFNEPTAISYTNYLGEFPQRISAVKGAGGVIYALSEMTVHYKFGLLEQRWKVTPRMRLLMDDPIVGAVVKGGTQKIVFAGGAVDARDEKEGLAVEIYDSETNSWEVCNPMPRDFKGCASSRLVTAVVHEGRFYAYYIYAGFVSELDLTTKQWTKVRTMRLPYEVQRSYLVSQSSALFVVGIQNENEKDLRFNLWTVNNATVQLSECIHSKVAVNALEYSDPTAVCEIYEWTSAVLTSAFQSLQRLYFSINGEFDECPSAWRSLRQSLPIASSSVRSR